MIDDLFFFTIPTITRGNKSTAANFKVILHFLYITILLFGFFFWMGIYHYVTFIYMKTCQPSLSTTEEKASMSDWNIYYLYTYISELKPPDMV